MSFSALVANETKLQVYEMKQYWFETISSLVMMCAVFAGLFYGVKSFTNPGDGATSLDGLVFGFLLWIFALSAYSSITKSLVEDNQKGFLEQLFLCPQGITQLMLARALVEMLWSMVFVTLLAWITMALTGNWIDLNFFYFYLLMLISSLSLIGLGFIVCGLALNFKKVGTIAALFNVAFMGLVAIDALPLNVFALLPFTAGASLSRDIILQNEPLNLTHLAIVASNSAVYLGVGIYLFKRLVKRAKRLNLIGQY
ncbi:MAG: ABC transporter permease [Psychrosphaera sp.]|nr:ABC transporter permease [Psychrosphaera sp.]